MSLDAKLNSISSTNAVAEIASLLDRSYQLNISWSGQRQISVDGYTDAIEIDKIAAKYINASAFENEKASLQERLDCNDLWEKVEQLYSESNCGLESTLVFKYLVYVKETFISHHEIRDYFSGKTDFRNSLFEFSPKKFKNIWPDRQPQRKSWGYNANEDSEKWLANKEMITLALSKEKL